MRRQALSQGLNDIGHLVLRQKIYCRISHLENDGTFISLLVNPTTTRSPLYKPIKFFKTLRSIEYLPSSTFKKSTLCFPHRYLASW